MSIQGPRSAAVGGAMSEARASRGKVLVADEAGEEAQAGGADGASTRSGSAQRSAAPGSGVAAGRVVLDGPLAYRRGALAEVPRALERGRRLDVRV